MIKRNKLNAKARTILKPDLAKSGEKEQSLQGKLIRPSSLLASDFFHADRRYIPGGLSNDNRACLTA